MQPRHVSFHITPSLKIHLVMNGDASGACTSWPTHFCFKMRKLNRNITGDLLLCNLEFVLLITHKKKTGNGKEIIIHNEPFVVVVFIISIKLKK